MSKTEMWQSVYWTFKMLLMAGLGLLWVLGPSLLVFNIGMLLGPYIGWPAAAVQVAATNAFIIWTCVQIAFVIFDHYMHARIRYIIEDYHEELIVLKRRWFTITGTSSELETLKSLKSKLAD